MSNSKPIILSLALALSGVALTQNTTFASAADEIVPATEEALRPALTLRNFTEQGYTFSLTDARGVQHTYQVAPRPVDAEGVYAENPPFPLTEEYRYANDIKVTLLDGTVVFTADRVDTGGIFSLNNGNKGYYFLNAAENGIAPLPWMTDIVDAVFSNENHAVRVAKIDNNAAITALGDNKGAMLIIEYFLEIHARDGDLPSCACAINLRNLLPKMSKYLYRVSQEEAVIAYARATHFGDLPQLLEDTDLAAIERILVAAGLPIHSHFQPAEADGGAEADA